MIIAGGGSSVPAVEITALARQLGWPVLADPRSGVEGVDHWDAVLRSQEFTDSHRPDIVLRFGGPPASRVLAEWLAATGAIDVVVAPRWIDPERIAAYVVSADHVMANIEPADATWASAWNDAGQQAEKAIADALADHPEVTEPGVARAVVDALPDDAALMVASSMPIRDVEWYATGTSRLRVIANRGANGIDGTISTAIGAAVARRGAGPTAVLLGDIAFLHDSTALVGLVARNVDLTLVVVDNDGGGIFSFLPQAAALSGDRFEQLFGTPHGVDLPSLAAAHGIATDVVATTADLTSSVQSAVSGGGVRLVVVRTDRDANVKLHAELNAAVAAAIAGNF